ncbi:carbohydrate ABC transporter permease [Cohnella fermenti]|uniref:Sugar ABC transporter permease n=1 Tax=Cohnella fermenti TaxID=2565925 RepID=A0A4S4C376_9BACL|nr:sugar ABC transporter permease [Cohnella fermenti]THF82187.1 sugar ABC transporter permease [Cohnella fermenti]
MRRRTFNLEAYLFVAPPFAFFVLFIVYPLVRNALYSFTDFRLTNLHAAPFVGLDNYVRVLEDPVFWISIRNVLIYGAISVPGQIAIGFAIAFVLDRRIAGVRLFRTLYFIPVITSWVVASLIFKFIFTDRGLLNYVLSDVLHLTGEPISWLSTPLYAMIVLSLLGIWKGTGWVMVMYLAALQNVPKDLYEAAAMDGATVPQSVRYITLPAVREMTGFVQIMLIIGAFNVFTSVYLVTDGGPLNQTEVMLTWMYRQAFGHYDLGYASALSFLFAIPIGLLTWVRFRLTERSGT